MYNPHQEISSQVDNCKRGISINFNYLDPQIPPSLDCGPTHLTSLPMPTC